MGAYRGMPDLAEVERILSTAPGPAKLRPPSEVRAVRAPAIAFLVGSSKSCRWCHDEPDEAEAFI